MDKTIFKMQPGESFEDYCHRISSMREELNMTWTHVAAVINENASCDYSADKFRKQEKRYSDGYKDKPIDIDELDEDLYGDLEELEDEDNDEDDVNLDTLDKIRLERIKLADERNQIAAMYRRISREETLKEIARDAVKSLPPIKFTPYKGVKNSDKAAILCISDFHYGIEIDSYFNKYNPDIAKERIANLTEKVINNIESRGISDLYVVNLGDLISGKIHQQIRINNRIDVVTQIMQISEIVAQMLGEFSEHANITYCDTLDNHSRIEPNIKDSLELESLSRITKWYLKQRLPEINYIENTYGDDIVDFKIFGHNIIGVHGHKDKQIKVIDGLTTMTKKHYDLILTAHMHHFSCDEKNETILVSNSSLMGTDEYAVNLRLTSLPSQNLIIVSEENPVEEILRILV